MGMGDLQMTDADGDGQHSTAPCSHLTGASDHEVPALGLEPSGLEATVPRPASAAMSDSKNAEGRGGTAASLSMHSSPAIGKPATADNGLKVDAGAPPDSPGNQPPAILSPAQRLGGAAKATKKKLDGYSTKRERAELEALFGFLDANGNQNGRVEVDEVENVLLAAGVPAEKIWDLFTEADKNADHSLDFGEFCGMFFGCMAGKMGSSNILEIAKTVGCFSVDLQLCCLRVPITSNKLVKAERSYRHCCPTFFAIFILLWFTTVLALGGHMD